MPDRIPGKRREQELHVACKMVSCFPYRGTLKGKQVCGRGWTKQKAVQELERKIDNLQPYGRHLSDCYARYNTESYYTVMIPDWIASIATIFQRSFRNATFFLR